MAEPPRLPKGVDQRRSHPRGRGRDRPQLTLSFVDNAVNRYTAASRSRLGRLIGGQTELVLDNVWANDDNDLMVAVWDWLTSRGPDVPSKILRCRGLRMGGRTDHPLGVAVVTARNLRAVYGLNLRRCVSFPPDDPPQPWSTPRTPDRRPVVPYRFSRPRRPVDVVLAVVVRQPGVAASAAVPVLRPGVGSYGRGVLSQGFG